MHAMPDAGGLKQCNRMAPYHNGQRCCKHLCSIVLMDLHNGGQPQMYAQCARWTGSIDAWEDYI